MRILLLDESPDFRSIIADWLNEFFGAVSIDSASGCEALAAIERRRPELVLASHATPLLDAIELARVVKARPNAPAVVVIGAGSDAGLQARCAAAGADFCVEKRHLQARLLAFLQQRFPKAWAEGVAARAMTARPRQPALAGEHRARRVRSEAVA